jgi:hypothetical protein
VALERHLHQDLKDHVPWGLRNKLVEQVLTMILDSVKDAGSSGPVLLGCILAGQYKLKRDEDVKQPSE